MRARSFFFASSVVALASLIASACSGGSDGDQPLLGPGDDAGADATTGDTFVEDTGGISLDTGGGEGGGCTTGEACGDGGTCVGGTCCDTRVCGDVCCGATEVCSFGKCVAPGMTCNDSSDCPSGSYCEFGLGTESGDAGVDGGSCTSGAAIKEGKCLPSPPICPPGGGGAGVTCLEKCEVKPTVGAFAPVVKYAWGEKTVAPFDTDIMMTPVVMQLDDDDCDGKITARDIPEIIFSTFQSGAYHDNGKLHAISIVKGVVKDKWTVAGVHPTKQLAAGNVDGKPGNEVVACWGDGTVHALAGDGTPLWATTGKVDCAMPSIADLDGDGVPEVIVEGGILDGATGALKHAYAAPLKGPPVVSDIDGDGKLDVVTGPQAFKADGSLIVDIMTADTSSFGPPAGEDWKFPGAAIADFDKDGKPEIVVMHNLSHTLIIWRYDASKPAKWSLVRDVVDINGTLPTSLCSPGQWGNTHGGGPPTIADFDGDGTPDVALAGGVGYAVFDGKKLIDPTVAAKDTFLWVKQTHDCSSASTGSTVFDFDGDGKAEVVYSDELHLRIYEGPNGNSLFETCNTTATLIENPVVADVDNDGQADLVVVSNAYAFACAEDATKRYSGIRVFGDTAGKWVRTRRVWNEHAYHVTNVGEDGTIPKDEPKNWTTAGLNNFRQNKQPGDEFSAIDAIVSIDAICPGPTALAVTVRNVGQAAMPPGAVATVYKGAAPGTEIGKVTTTLTLYPAESEKMILPLGAMDSDVKDGSALVFAIVVPPASVKECRADNNSSSPMKAKCTGPK
ncbi:MAG: FG-GAP repeat domain-containing protein [Polyangiales bacterium]